MEERWGGLAAWEAIGEAKVSLRTQKDMGPQFLGQRMTKPTKGPGAILPQHHIIPTSS